MVPPCVLHTTRLPSSGQVTFSGSSSSWLWRLQYRLWRRSRLNASPIVLRSVSFSSHVTQRNKVRKVWPSSGRLLLRLVTLLKKQNGDAWNHHQKWTMIYAQTQPRNVPYRCSRLIFVWPRQKRRVQHINGRKKKLNLINRENNPSWRTYWLWQ